MKPYRKIFLAFLSVVIILLIVAAVLASRIAKKGLPVYEGVVQISSISDSVKVYRDESGIPHIVAQNEHDLYLTVGYVMAQDRLWQMDLLRRVTLGRLSEIFGDDFVNTDLLLRSLEYSKKSEMLLSMSSSDIINALEAFSAGVNQYIQETKGNYPLEFTLLGYEPEEWEPYQSINLIGFMAWDLKAGWNELVLEKLKSKLDSSLYAELMPQSNRFKSYVFGDEQNELMNNNALLELNKLDKLGLDVFCGSNNWAVAGTKSRTGKPILANDMHLSFSVPGIWMQMHQIIPGKLNVSGLALPGQPMVIVGHNDSIAWGMTNTYVDNLDFYEEKVNPENTDQYLYNGKWMDFEVEHVAIKSSSDSVFKRTYKRSHRGPVVSGEKGIEDRVLTIQWVGDWFSNELLSVYKANRASNWSEFKEAFSTFIAISQNIAYADVNGNIGLYACAGVPIRKRNSGFEVLPGWTSEYDWSGLIPFKELPHEYNPERGYVSSANNKTIADSYKYHIGTWYSMPYRIERIRELLNEKEKLSVEDFKSMQNDFQSTYAKRFMTKFFPLINVEGNKRIYQEAYNQLAGWNGLMDKKLVAPSLFETTLYTLLGNTFADEMGEELYGQFFNNGKLTRIAIYNILETDFSPWIDNITTDEVETLADIINKSFIDAVDTLAEKYRSKPTSWKWGNIHQITFAHPLSKKEALDKVFNLNRGPYKVSGSFHTVSPYTFSNFTPEKVVHGASHRHIYSLENWEHTQSVIPTGNSGHVKSEFYMSQTQSFINGQYNNDMFSVEAVKANYKYLLLLTPKRHDTE